MNQPTSRRLLSRRSAVWGLALVVLGLALLQPTLGSKPATRQFAGRFSNATWAPVSPLPLDKASSDELAQQQTQLAREHLRQPSPETWRAIALLQARLGNLEEAVERLREGVARFPKSVDLWSDLGAVSLEWAKAGPSRYPLIDGLAALQRARKLDPNHATAAFNEALLLSELPLPHQAKIAWERYLTNHSEAGWDEEAREQIVHLENIKVDASPHSPNSLSARILDELLPAWAEAVVAGNGDGAQQALESAKAAVAQLGGYPDRLAHDAVAWAETNATSNAALAVLQLREGKKLRANRAQIRAMPLLEKAFEKFRETASPLSVVAETERRSIWIFEKVDRAEAGIKELVSTCDEQGYLRNAGLLEWIYARALHHSGDAAGALSYFQRSRLKLGQIEDPLLFALGPMIAEIQQRLGLDSESWEEQLKALPQLFEVASAQWIHNGLYQIIGALELGGRTEQARVFARELLDNGHDSGTGWILIESLARFAALTSDRRLEQIQKDLLAQAHDLLATEAAGPLKKRMEADLAVLGLQVDLAASAPGTLNRVTEALGLYQHTGQAEILPRLLLLRAQTHQSFGDLDLAASDLNRAIQIIEERRRAPKDAATRISYFATAQKIYEERVRLALAQGDTATAFFWSDAARARELSPAKLERPTLEVQRGMVLLELMALPESLVIFRLDESGLRAITIPVQREELEESIVRLIHMLAENRPEDLLRVQLAEFYDLILRPSILPSDETLVIIPDGMAHNLPFAAFFDVVTESYVAETRVVVVAPNAEGARDRLRGKQRRLQGDRLLAIGNPAFDRLQFPGRPLLPGSEREARDVAALYPNPTLLLGPAADRKTILDKISVKPNVLHISGHSLIDRQDPSRSTLLVAPDDAGNSVIAASDLDSIDLLGIEVAILSACDTLALLPTAGREGLGGWTRSLLAQGVPVVIATVWNADDESTLVFMSAFHSKLKARHDLATAFAEAQRLMIKSPRAAERSPSRWAVFQFVERNTDGPTTK